MTRMLLNSPDAAFPTQEWVQPCAPTRQGKDLEFQISSEAPLLVNGRDGLSVPNVAEVSLLPAIGEQAGAKHGRTLPALIANAPVDNPTGATLAELQGKLL